MAASGMLGGASALHQAINRSRLLETARSVDLVTEVVADRAGYLDACVTDWGTYWQPHAAGLNGVGRKQLAELERTREAYFGSAFDVSKAVPYCYAYFRLLRSALNGSAGVAGAPFSQALAGLEVWGVRGFGDRRSPAAGVISLRHPAHLLARLRWPRAQVDPKFLPLVCLPPETGQMCIPARLFYHYRQISLDADTGLALLVYPSVPLVGRASSFECLQYLTSALRPKPDPWSRRRACQIADNAIGPFLAACPTRFDGLPAGELAFADIGGGSGVLVSHLCRRLLRSWRDAVGERHFAWTFVDLNVRDPARHTARRPLRRAMSFAEYVEADYRSWILREAHGPWEVKWHVALLCRLLNNLSDFSIEWTADSDEQRMLAGKPIDLQPAPEAGWRPGTCLCPHIADPSRLLVSVGQVELRDGRSMRQASLTDYFEALHRLTQGAAPPIGDSSPLFFPVRRFNPGALVLHDGSSLFERLCAIASLVVVEDVDLAPTLLMRHLEGHHLGGLAASDATNRRRAHSSSLLCVAGRDRASCLPGRRLW